MIVVKELEEKTGIKGSTIGYWGIDKQFNYNIYLYQLEMEDKME